MQNSTSQTRGVKAWVQIPTEKKMYNQRIAQYVSCIVNDASEWETIEGGTHESSSTTERTVHHSMHGFAQTQRPGGVLISWHNRLI